MVAGEEGVRIPQTDPVGDGALFVARHTKIMRTLKIAWMLGMGFCLNAVAEPLLRKDRPVDVEDVPDVQMRLEVQGGDDALIREVLREAGLGGVIVEEELELLKVEPPRDFLLARGEDGKVAMKQALDDLEELVDAEDEQSEGRWMIGVLIDVPEDGSLMVQSVIDGTPAQKAGLKQGDRIVSLNGLKLRDMEMLVDLVQLVQDQRVALQVKRGEGKMKIKVAATSMEIKEVAAFVPETPPRVNEERRLEQRQERARQEEMLRIRRQLEELMGRLDRLEK